MHASTDVLVIGAGPYGLSISTHLRDRGVEHTIVGRPMDTWRAHMPLGLFLKSQPWAASISAAMRGYDIATYYGLRGLDDYSPRGGVISLERFLGYADWFTSQLVPDIRDLTVTDVTPVDGGFHVEFADECPVTARQVIVATGLIPYAHIPDELSGLPAGLMTHSSVHDRLDQFRGRRLAVVGAGQSSLQTAALLHEAGAEVQVIARTQRIRWQEDVVPEIRLRDYIMRPPTRMCEGWDCVFYASPDLFRLMPQSLRLMKVLANFGPSGAWWLRDRVEGVLDVLTGHRIKSAEPHGSGVRLHLDGPRQSVVDADHVIAATGFRVDVSRLLFLSTAIRAALVKYANFPVVNKGGESSIPGLYFAGAHTMLSLGPGVRFLSGTHTTADRLARSVAQRMRCRAHDADPVAQDDSSPGLAAAAEQGS